MNCTLPGIEPGSPVSVDTPVASRKSLNCNLVRILHPLDSVTSLGRKVELRQAETAKWQLYSAAGGEIVNRWLALVAASATGRSADMDLVSLRLGDGPGN